MSKPALLTPMQEYLAYVRDDDRLAIAADIEEVGSNDYEGIARVARRLLIHILQGNLPTAVAKECRELLQTEIIARAAADRAAEGTAHTAGNATFLMQVINEAAQPRRIEAKYTVDATPEELDELEALKAKAG